MSEINEQAKHCFTHVRVSHDHVNMKIREAAGRRPFKVMCCSLADIVQIHSEVSTCFTTSANLFHINLIFYINL